MNRLTTYSGIATLAIFSAFAIFFFLSINNLYAGFAEEKYIDKRISLDIVCDEADMLVAEGRSAEILARVITKLDAVDGTICAVYDKDFTLLSGRKVLAGTTPFTLLDYPDLISLLQKTRAGETSVWYAQHGFPPHNISVYFRWVGDAFAMIGVSKYATNYQLGQHITSEASWLTISSLLCFGLTGFSFWRERRRSKHG